MASTKKWDGGALYLELWQSIVSCPLSVVSCPCQLSVVAALIHNRRRVTGELSSDN